MRTTVDLPDDLHQILKSIARDRGESVSHTISDLLMATIAPQSQGAAQHVGPTVDPATGLAVLSLGRVTTMDDVRSLEDDW